jgi:hypothetical protein
MGKQGSRTTTLAASFYHGLRLGSPPSSGRLISRAYCGQCRGVGWSRPRVASRRVACGRSGVHGHYSALIGMVVPLDVGVLGRVMVSSPFLDVHAGRPLGPRCGLLRQPPIQDAIQQAVHPRRSRCGATQEDWSATLTGLSAARTMRDY